MPAKNAASGCTCDRFPNTPRCSDELARQRGCIDGAASDWPRDHQGYPEDFSDHPDHPDNAPAANQRDREIRALVAVGHGLVEGEPTSLGSVLWANRAFELLSELRVLADEQLEGHGDDAQVSAHDQPAATCPVCKRERFYLAQGFEYGQIIVLGTHTCEKATAKP